MSQWCSNCCEVLVSKHSSLMLTTLFKHLLIQMLNQRSTVQYCSDTTDKSFEYCTVDLWFNIWTSKCLNNVVNINNEWGGGSKDTVEKKKKRKEKIRKAREEKKRKEKKRKEKKKTIKGKQSKAKQSKKKLKSCSAATHLKSKTFLNFKKKYHPPANLKIIEEIEWMKIGTSL